VEKSIDQLGSARNQDKPSVVGAQTVVPAPRLNFCGGKGSIAVNPLRLNPFTATRYDHVSSAVDEPRNMYPFSCSPGGGGRCGGRGMRERPLMAFRGTKDS